jgi:hypothetical protein
MLLTVFIDKTLYLDVTVGSQQFKIAYGSRPNPTVHRYILRVCGGFSMCSATQPAYPHSHVSAATSTKLWASCES